MESAATEDYGIKASGAQDAASGVLAFGGPVRIRWDEDAKVTPWGGMSYFAAYLRTSGLFDRLVADAPFRYASPNAPKVRDVVGTIVLAILAGYRRHRHVERPGNDAACADLLGMSKVMSDESVRRALKRCGEAELDAWLTRHEREVVESLLRFDYVMDVDSTVRTVYGRQEGAEPGYNPHKPGRPSLNCHTFFVGTARVVVGADVLPGSRHAGRCGLPWLAKFMEGVPEGCRPRLLRGDAGYGNEAFMAAAEAARVKCLFKVKRSRNVVALFRRHALSDDWRDCGDGWECVDTSIRLDGWTAARRCLLVRRPSRRKPGAAPAKRGRGRPKKEAPAPVQQEFEFVEDRRGRDWDFYAPVTNDPGLAPVALTQPCRDRGDCENFFDEYKNQWGGSGFVTKSLGPTRAMARLVALVANWWNVFARLANGERHMEAATSRPMLMGVVGRIVTGGRRRTMRLTSTHAKSAEIRLALDRIGAFLGRISAIAPQLGFERTWALILKVAFRKWLCGRPSRRSRTARSSSFRWRSEPTRLSARPKPTVKHAAGGFLTPSSGALRTSNRGI